MDLKRRKIVTSVYQKPPLFSPINACCWFSESQDSCDSSKDRFALHAMLSRFNLYKSGVLDVMPQKMASHLGIFCELFH